MNIYSIPTETTFQTPSISGGGPPIKSIVGAIIGILLSLILGVTIILVVLYLVKRRKTGEKYSTGRQNSEKKVYGMGRYIPYIVGNF